MSSLNRMVAGLAAALGVAAAVLYFIPEAKPDAPVKTLMLNKGGPVVFNHKAHSGYKAAGLAVKCESCHHTGKTPAGSYSGCGDCHKAEENREFFRGTFDQAYYRNHLKSMGWGDRAFSESIHGPHMTLAKNCGACHHENTYIKDCFTEKLHDLHMDKCDECTACHHDEKIEKEPSSCTGCHAKGKSAQKVEYRQAVHSKCFDCHDENKNNGLKGCKGCHAGSDKKTAATCASCHGRGREAEKVSVAQALHSKCLACHKDLAANGLKGCSACHAGKSPENYQGRSFSACAECHGEKAAVSPRASALHKQCNSCHGAANKADGKKTPMCTEKNDCGKCHMK